MNTPRKSGTDAPTPYQAHRYWASCELRWIRAMVRNGNSSHANARKARESILRDFAQIRSRRT